MRSKSLQKSAWLGLVLASVLLGTMSTGANAGPGNATVITGKGSNGVALRFKGAIDALLEPLGLRAAPERGRPRFESADFDLGPLE
jgi:hypothetical protein